MPPHIEKAVINLLEDYRMRQKYYQEINSLTNIAFKIQNGADFEEQTSHLDLKQIVTVRFMVDLFNRGNSNV